jgi:hypothetical protein
LVWRLQAGLAWDSFDLSLLYYSYPGSLQSAKLDYLEIDAAASYTFFDWLTHGVANL